MLKQELNNKENTINNLSMILKNITSGRYNVSPSNKESSNEPILENSTDHIDSANDIVCEILNVEFEHLQRRYQHLISRQINQSRPLAITDAAVSLDVTKGYKVIESNVQNPELNNRYPSIK